MFATNLKKNPQTKVIATITITWKEICVSDVKVFTPHDPHRKIRVGVVGIAWMFYKEGIEKEKWMDRQPFWSSVVDSDSKGGEMRNILPLFKTIAERSLCTVASEKHVSSQSFRN
jgi:hypothetical protein